MLKKRTARGAGIGQNDDVRSRKASKRSQHGSNWQWMVVNIFTAR
jgi:hypothetical protein